MKCFCWTSTSWWMCLLSATWLCHSTAFRLPLMSSQPPAAPKLPLSGDCLSLAAFQDFFLWLAPVWLWCDCIYHAWGSRIFLGMHINLFHQIWSFQPLFSKTLLCPFPLLSGDSHYMDVVPLTFEALFIFLPSFFSLFFRMHNFYCSIFKFPASYSFLNLSLC